jgi:thymidylate synthase (FAD)
MSAEPNPGPPREKSAPGTRAAATWMRATLLFPDREIVERFYVPIIYTACRTCYSEQDPDVIFERALAGDFDPLKMQKLISSVIESGHGSTIEHIVFTFGISGVSRTLSHQLVRHRAGVAFDQQSQRYVKFKGAATMLPHSIAEGDPALRGAYEEQVDVIARPVRRDARRRRARGGRAVRLPERDPDEPRHDDEPAGAHPHVGPAAVHDGPVGDPAALPAHPPRDLRVSPFLGSFLAPKCVPLGYCDEFNNRDEHCPIRPHKDDVLGAWAEKAAAARAAGRELPVS